MKRLLVLLMLAVVSAFFVACSPDEGLGIETDSQAACDVTIAIGGENIIVVKLNGDDTAYKIVKGTPEKVETSQGEVPIGPLDTIVLEKLDILPQSIIDYSDAVGIGHGDLNAEFSAQVSHLLGSTYVRFYVPDDEDPDSYDSVGSLEVCP